MVEDARDVHDLIERLGNLVRANMRAVCSEFGVRPVQLETLRFLTQCNRYSDTPQAVTEFLGLTKGTVSQTLKVLERKRLLRKRSDPQDKRLVHLKPTAKGRRLVERAVPAASVALGVGKPPISDNQLAVDALRTLLRSVQVANDLKTFAPCHDCRFIRECEDGYFCGLTHEPLADQDTALLCREHRYP